MFYIPILYSFRFLRIKFGYFVVRCFCLCRGFALQTTVRIFLRRTIRQCWHIFFTAERYFISRMALKFNPKPPVLNIDCCGCQGSRARLRLVLKREEVTVFTIKFQRKVPSLALSARPKSKFISDQNFGDIELRYLKLLVQLIKLS